MHPIVNRIHLLNMDLIVILLHNNSIAIEDINPIISKCFGF